MPPLGIGRAPGGSKPPTPLGVGRAPGGRKPAPSPATTSSSAGTDADLIEGKVELPRDMVGRVIGSGGSVINAIRRKSHADIQIVKHEDGSATLSICGVESMLSKVMAMLKIVVEDGGVLEEDDTETPRAPTGRASGLGLGARAAAPSRPLAGLPPPPPAAARLSRPAAERLSEQWIAARRAKQYATADALRDRLRKAGYEPQDVVEEIALYGYTGGGAVAEEDHDGGGGAAPDGGSAAGASGASVVAAEEDPLAYRETVQRPEGYMGPTDAAKNHRDGGTAGLLTLNYQQIEPLPPEIGFTVTSGFTSATADPLLTLRRLQEEEAAREREEIRRRNAKSLPRPLLDGRVLR